jgi:hypothetical protein
MQPSAACCHGEYGSVTRGWQSASLSLRQNSPLVCSLESLVTMVRGTPSRWNTRDRVLVYSRRYPKYSRPTLLLIPLSPCVVRDRGARSPSGYEPFCCLAFGSAAEHQSPSVGGEREFISVPPLPSIFKNALIPLLRVDQPTTFVYFIGSTYLPTLELV